MKMRIRKKFAVIFSVVSFFIVFYIWINNALPTSVRPVSRPEGPCPLPYSLTHSPFRAAAGDLKVVVRRDFFRTATRMVTWEEEEE